ncbi:MAG: dephospho-CoA kinase [Aeromicrobium sp.]|uniref:dephospho-CoA kinase n=1 Tax=Aeromicrobium sp. TaxID=1871063 RepID=UPI0039E72925
MRVGLTGGIASGKSSVSALLRDHGAVVVDYDLIAREVVEPGTPALAAIAGRFGDAVIDAEGRLDRPALGAIVFADEASRRDLEAVTHPAIRQRAAEVEAEAGEGAVVVHDNPLLVEMGAHADCDAVVVVAAPEASRIERMTRDRGMAEADARARIAAQASDDERAAVADLVIDNSGSREDLADEVAVLWSELLVRAAAQ